MKKIIYTLIAAFVACTAVAQTPSAYFMEGSTFRSQLNPAFAPLRGYVNIPVLGGVQVNVSGNLSVSDIFYPVNGSLVTLFDKNVSAAEALGNLRSKNMLGTDARINIVGFGAFRKDHKTFWSFDLNMRVEAEANMPYSLFDFLKNGRNEAVINDIKASTQAYLEAAFSYSFPLTDQIYLGARGKFLVGAGRARTSIDRLDIKLQENSWNIDADGSFEMSGLEMSSMQRPDGSEYYSFNDFDVSSYKGPAGYGFAVDLGVMYDVIPDLQLSFAVNDLGFISWGKKYLERGQMTKSQSFTGVEIIDGEVHDPEFDFGELEFDRVQASKGKTEMLRTSINLGAEYEVWRHKIGLGLLYNVRVWDVKTFHKPDRLGELPPDSLVYADYQLFVSQRPGARPRCGDQCLPQLDQLLPGDRYVDLQPYAAVPARHFDFDERDARHRRSDRAAQPPHSGRVSLPIIILYDIS